MFGSDVSRDARLHAIREFPKESVGYVVDGAYVPQKNISAVPEESFEVAPSAWLSKTPVQAVIHSHPRGNSWPSPSDQEHQMATAVPWGITVCDGERAAELFWFGDQVPIPPLEGPERYYRYGVMDCWSLIRDWYRVERGITLKNYARDWEWWVDKKENHYVDNFRDAGFVEVKDPIEGDLFLARFGTRSSVSHGGIYLGGCGDMILHHLCGGSPVDFSRLSSRQPGGRFLALHGTHFLRYEGAS